MPGYLSQMEQDREPVRLKLDEDNSLVFEVKIEGEAPASAPVYRMVCETGDMALAFRGAVTDEGVMFRVPALQNKIKEGSYDAHLEVVIENKLLIPLQFMADFVIPTRVQVESVRVGPKPVESKPTQSASAKLLKVEGKDQKKATPPVTKPKVEPAKKAPAPQKKHPTLREMYSKKGEK
jgi:hypothetical protein